MKKLLPLFSCLLLIGCGEKSSSEGSESASENPTASNESAEPSADTAKQSPAEPPAAESPSEEPSDTPNSLSDADVERLLKEAVDYGSIQKRDGLYYQVNESEPYSGWVKRMYDSGQAMSLARFKNGQTYGLMLGWHENGQMKGSGNFKDGKLNGHATAWHENGQKFSDATFTEDGELVSEKWWNDKGEEVETREEALKSASEGSESAGEKPTPSNESAEPSADTAKQNPAGTPVAESPSEEPSSATPNSLSDADVERLLKEAVEIDSLEERDGLFYQNNEPYSGWAKDMYDSENLRRLGKISAARGQVWALGRLKDGKPDGLQTAWHENGQKMNESTYKDGELISEKWWNAKGEEVDTVEEAGG
jgi:antitoxin component YwqK of YwqJK toxin-antitoxin module